MIANVGPADRAARIGAGAALLAAGALTPLGWWGLVGLVPLLTGLARRCPAYSLVGASTCPRKPV